jgi:mRNA interferase RelE/StbE
VEAAESTAEIAHLKKLRTGQDFYRIRIADFRIGIRIQEDGVHFVRCLDRKEIYRYFP